MNFDRERKFSYRVGHRVSNGAFLHRALPFENLSAKNPGKKSGKIRENPGKIRIFKIVPNGLIRRETQ